MFGFEKTNSNEGVQKELERAQTEKLAVMQEPDSAQKEGKLQALNDIIANLQEQIGVGLETATEGTTVESQGDVNIDSATVFINEMLGKATLSPEDEEELGRYTRELTAEQKMKPDSQKLQIALTLLSDIRTKNMERKEGQGAS
jgi:hypothetical protein